MICKRRGPKEFREFCPPFAPRPKASCSILCRRRGRKGVVLGVCSVALMASLASEPSSATSPAWRRREAGGFGLARGELGPTPLRPRSQFGHLRKIPDTSPLEASTRGWKTPCRLTFEHAQHRPEPVKASRATKESEVGTGIRPITVLTLWISAGLTQA